MKALQGFQHQARGLRQFFSLLNITDRMTSSELCLIQIITFFVSTDSSEMGGNPAPI